ncbi:MAG: hypothetical protein WAX07_01145 [Candidatus Altiarchaeia archaeon]
MSKASPVLSECDLQENDLHMLIGKKLKTFFHIRQNLIFFEVPVGESRADILCVQPPMPYETVLPAGIHLFEVKMKKDKDRQRLERQLCNYTSIVDYVWLIGVDKPMDADPEKTGILVFDTGKCRISVAKEARSNNPDVDICMRQELLKRLAKDLKNKYDHVCEMARTNHRSKTSRVMIQQKL